MLDAGDAMRSVISKRTVCPKGSSKTMEEGLHEILIAIIITAEEAMAETLDTKDGVR